jgi:hypothetical protein
MGAQCDKPREQWLAIAEGSRIREESKLGVAERSKV